VATPVAPVPAPEPVVIAAPEPVAAPVAVEPTAIVALEYPEHRAIKAMAKGYTRVGEVIALTRDVDTLTDALALRRAGMPAGVLITGPAGTAKTRLAEAFAGANGLPFLKISGGKIRSADDWFGGWGKDASGKLSWRPSPLTRVMDEGIECVVLVDEINRVESERALNGLFSVLDESGSTFIPDANRNVKMPKGILVIATANIGPEFVGTIPLDGALRDRLPWGVRMNYPVEAIEQKLLVDLTGLDGDTAGKLVRVANTQRAKRMDPLAFPSRSVISTRVLLDVARRVTQTGRDPREALWGALRGRFSPEDEPSLSVCVDAQFDAPPVEDEDINEVDLVGL
jgi:MoxR-like ATPase